MTYTYVYGGFYIVRIMKIYSDVFWLNGTILGITSLLRQVGEEKQQSYIQDGTVLAFLCLPWSQTK